jgi:hypothetical protein
MSPDGIVKAVDIATSASGRVMKSVLQTSSDFRVLKKVSTIALS